MPAVPCVLPSNRFHLSSSLAQHCGKNVKPFASEVTWKLPASRISLLATGTAEASQLPKLYERRTCALSLLTKVHHLRLPSVVRVSYPEAPEPEDRSKTGELTEASAEHLLSQSGRTVAILAFWAAFLCYAVYFAPNETPAMDVWSARRLLGLDWDASSDVSPVLSSLWNLFGMYPVLFSALLIPASRTSRAVVPAWPFAAASVAMGALALLPFFALWRPGEPVLPSAEERSSLSLRVCESKLTAAATLLAVFSQVLAAAMSPQCQWAQYQDVFVSSRLFHVTTLDFTILTACAPIWMLNDMHFRHWEPRESWGLALVLLPVLGPYLYLCLRPGLPSATHQC